ncbi:hypothetical protein FA95DRAFT_1577712 [Auriscalpium vulgare]|uniref:Uncharacterized protein n=1 Tax=Auriscalpium vulgare TaxID=40419 RepID=A0ACB8R6T8_9AGAM|nr:hypothetical protein FA95DRAFT_1577712 [Auriscalpium vulgare]
MTEVHQFFVGQEDQLPAPDPSVRYIFFYLIAPVRSSFCQEVVRDLNAPFGSLLSQVTHEMTRFAKSRYPLTFQNVANIGAPASVVTVNNVAVAEENPKRVDASQALEPIRRAVLPPNGGLSVAFFVPLIHERDRMAWVLRDRIFMLEDLLANMRADVEKRGKETERRFEEQQRMIDLQQRMIIQLQQRLDGQQAILQEHGLV